MAFSETLELLNLVESGQKVGKLHAQRARNEILLALGADIQVPIPASDAEPTIDFTVITDPTLDAKERALIATSKVALALEKIVIKLAEIKVIQGIHSDLFDAILFAKTAMLAAGVETAKLSVATALKMNPKLKFPANG